MPTKTFFRLRDEKQESILRAAIHEFVEHGFDHSKVETIAKNAGVATGSIYQYFEDKRELFVYCAEWGLDLFMKKIGERSKITDMDVFEYFNDSITKMELLSEERELSMFMQSISKEPDLLNDSMKAMYSSGDKYITALLQTSKIKGVVRNDIDDDLLKEFFNAVTSRFTARWSEQYSYIFDTLSEEQNLEMKRELDQMIELLKRGIGA